MEFAAARERVAARHRTLASAIRSHLAADDILPALILLYSQIDAIAWLGRPAATPAEPAGPVFEDWVRKYVLVHGETATPVDLWGARCAVLHTQTPESRVMRTRGARPIWYRLQNTRALVQSPSGSGTPLKVNPSNLAKKVERGIHAWLAIVDKDPLFQTTFRERVEQTFDPSQIESQDGTSFAADD